MGDLPPQPSPCYRYGPDIKYKTDIKTHIFVKNGNAFYPYTFSMVVKPTFRVGTYRLKNIQAAPEHQSFKNTYM